MFDSVIDYVVAWFMACVNYLLELVVSLVDSIMIPAVEALPDLRTGTAFLIDVIGLCNQFIALDYAVILFFSYLLYCGTLIMLNWVLGLIPTIN